MRILVSYWKNQTVFALTGRNREEQLGIGFETRRQTIVNGVDESQKRYLDILLQDCIFLTDNLKKIWKEIARDARILAEEAMDKGYGDCRILIESILEDVEWAEKKLF